MSTTFSVDINLKTPTGFERYGSFDLGEDSTFAFGLFSKLEGRPNATESDILQIDLVETYRNLPVNIRMIGCTIEELCRNVRLITKETFMRINLREIPG